MKIAVIPARGGSKRIPQKNIRTFAGMPMISWSIDAAKKSELFDHIIVSTDDQRIAEIAQEHDAIAPFLRPQHLSDDFTPTVPVIAHAVDWAERNLGHMEAVCCIYATAPFIEPNDIKDAYNTLLQHSAHYAFPVTSFSFPVQRGVRLRRDGRLEMLYPEHGQTRSQDLEESYHDVGQFYWGTAEAWKSDIPIIGPGAAPIVIPRYRVQDIDTEEDWLRAEVLFKVLSETTAVHGMK